MSQSLQTIVSELESLGFTPRLSASPCGTVISFLYTVETGTHRGKEFTVGLSLQGSEQYPEYPPHWIHVTPPLDDGKGGAVNHYRDPTGRPWIALSRPPGPLWDALPTKHMYAYLNEHLRRFWHAI